MRGASRPATLALCTLLLLGALAIALPVGAPAEQAAQPSAAAAGRLDAGRDHTCAVLAGGEVRCWGYGGDGALGYADRRTIGDDEAPGSAGPVNLGASRTITAISAGHFHTCAVLDDGDVRCWGFGGNGRLGYANGSITIGDDEAPASVGPVELGAGRATAISAGGAHTCALLEGGDVRCWGFAGGVGFGGQLGYGNTQNIGDDETPASAGSVNLGPGRTATAITAGGVHTCALLDAVIERDGVRLSNVRCWGEGANGRLGYSNQFNIGDDETPDSAGPVDLGGRRATAISAGDSHTCALLDNGEVRCWGAGTDSQTGGGGQLGYGNTQDIGDNENLPPVGPVDLGGRNAMAISAGGTHTCALLDDGSVRCWGYGASGRLGYGNQISIGDDETPGLVGPVDLGPGRTATAITAGRHHTCARLDDTSVRCWGYGQFGRLGYGNQINIGDDETPGSTGPVELRTPVSPPIIRGDPPARGPYSYPLDSEAESLRAQAARLRGLRRCLARVRRHTRREIRRARRLSGSRRARARRHARRHKSRLRRGCSRRWGRTPGRITGLKAHAPSPTEIILTFDAPGTDGPRPPAARAYLIKQSLRPIRSARRFRRAQTLCNGTCRFPTVTRVGTQINFRVTGLRPDTTYYYVAAARDNVSRRLGARSAAVKARTR
jgi:alpha-tubulin suppressor-like RCC1 family protein